MGNDNSKTTIENQQLIMQLQQQLYQQSLQQQQHQSQHPSQYNPSYHQTPPPQNPRYQQNPSHHQNPSHYSPSYHQNQQNPPPQKPSSLLAILGNKELMMEIDKNPSTKRKLLEKILNEHRHTMTSNQVSRITQILNNLPPEDNNDVSKYAFQNIYNNNNNTGNGIGNTSIGFNQGTTPRDNMSRELQTTQQINTIDALTRHYKTEAEEEEARFKIEEDRRRKEFAEKQRQRRLHYQASLSDLEKSNVDALRLFQLQKNYTIDDLKSA